MRHFSISGSAILLAAVSAIAQTQTLVPNPAVHPGGGNSANIWRAGINRVQCFYDSSNFSARDLDQPIVISAIEWRCIAAVAAPITYPSVEIYVGSAAVDYLTPTTTFASNRAPSFPTTPNYTGPVTINAGVAGDYVLNIPLTIPAQYQADLGADLLIEIVILANPTPLTGTNMDCGFNAALHNCNSLRSVGSTTALTGAVSAFCPIVRLSHTDAPGAATKTRQGQGCYNFFASIGELFADNTTFDLANSAVTFIPTGTGYVVNRTGAFQPVGTVQASPTPLVLDDDAETTVSFTTGTFLGPNLLPWTGVDVVSNGVIAEPSATAHPASAAGGGAPLPATWLNPAQTAFYCLADFDPSVATGGGTVTYEESASEILITWTNVPNWTATPPAAGTNTFQFQLYPSGIVTIAFGNLGSFGNNGGALVGYSPGGTNLDPGNADLSAIGGGAVLLEAVDTPAMSINCDRPVFGTTWDMAVSNVPTNSLIGLDIIGVSDPGFNDLFFIGMPGCGLRASLDFTNAWIPVGSSHSFGLAIPSGQPALTGLNRFSTTAVLNFLAPLNPFGALTANGVKGVLGSL